MLYDLDTTIIAGLIGILGAFGGGILCYKGAIRGAILGAERTFELQVLNEKKFGQETLLYQLEFLRKAIYEHEKNLYYVEELIWDKEWYKHTMQSEFTRQEKKNIISLIQNIMRRSNQNVRKLNNPAVTAGELEAYLGKIADFDKLIKDIINRYSN